MRPGAATARRSSSTASTISSSWTCSNIPSTNTRTAAWPTSCSAKAGLTRWLWTTSCPAGRPASARVHLEIQLGPRHRAAEQGASAAALVRLSRAKRACSPARGRRASTGPGIGAVSRRDLDRHRIPGRRAHGVGRDAHRGVGHLPRRARTIPSGQTQSVERNRMRRPLCARHGQLGRVDRTGGVRVPRAEAAHRFRAASASAGLPQCLTAAEAWGSLDQQRSATCRPTASKCSGANCPCRRWHSNCRRAGNCAIARSRPAAKQLMPTVAQNGTRVLITLAEPHCIACGESVVVQLHM